MLDKERRPLSADHIVELAVRQNLLRSVGKTPVNTMRARLSDDIRIGGIRSPFQRVGANRFGLREWNMTEYHSRPFTKEVPAEITVCIRNDLFPEMARAGVGFFNLPESLAAVLGNRTNLIFLDRRNAETTDEYRQLIAYTWLETTDGHVLTYTRGKYSAAHRTLLLGKKSVGFGGHVLQEDAGGLFGSPDAGVEQATLREIREELGGLVPISVERQGVIWDDTSSDGQRHIAIVMRGLIRSQDIAASETEFSINQLQLLSKQQLWSHFHSMEFWSQLLIRRFAASSKPSVISAIAPAKRPRQVRAIALVGEIATGKSTIAKALGQKLKYQVISVSEILRGMLGVRRLEEENRSQFQGLALEFIQAEGGPSNLADEIVRQVHEAPDRLPIIDGVRQLATLDHLRRRLRDLAVVYIDCPRDDALRHYQTRLPGATARQFALVREHEVESELPYFRFEADAILNNAGEVSSTVNVLLHWLQE